MATKKKATRKMAARYVALWSECGDDCQLQVVGGSNGDAYVRDSVAAAKKDAEMHSNIAKEDGDGPYDYAVAEIVARGKSSRLIWS